ncbi:hypothetical protein ACFYVR_20775 [Rhodococcus sp. NPDC003318]|uniref:hypothetical protein n=1 Tax=Rhodococcus sp. NPDC003318 TaxID=3364503 RepID=UPI0036A8290C
MTAAAGACGLLALFLLIAAIGCIAEGWYVPALFAFLFAFLLVLSVVTGVVMRRQSGTDVDIRTTTVDGSDVTEIRQPSLLFGLLAALMTVMAGLTGGAAVALFLNAAGFPGAALIAAALGLFAFGYLIAIATGRVRRGGLQLSREGIRHRGWSFESYLPWSAIVGAKAVQYQFPETLAIGYANAPWERDTGRGSTGWTGYRRYP